MLGMRVLADAQRVSELVASLGKAIAADLHIAKREQPWALIGLRSRGDVLARRLAALLEPTHLGTLDFTLYRDDLHAPTRQPVVGTSDVNFNIDGLDVVLVDDVLMTGRSVRAALQSLMDLGRPSRVWLAVLVDRGGRELPIAADQVALDLTGKRRRKGDRLAQAEVKPEEVVAVRLMPTDEQDAITVCTVEEQEQGSP
jgi:pyrimidine operon attenuation protein / uracil phosphoribosyltransferase